MVKIFKTIDFIIDILADEIKIYESMTNNVGANEISEKYIQYAKFR